MAKMTLSPIILLVALIMAGAPQTPGIAQISGVAQCLLCSEAGKIGEKPKGTERPLRIYIEADLNFSRIALGGSNGGAGAVSIDPASGIRRVDGAARDIGGMAVRGIVRVEGEPGRAIRIDLPHQVDLTGSHGGTAKVLDLRTDLPPAPRIGADGNISFAFGGKLEVSSGLSGELRGRIPITVDYI
jgi:hypothetical protein